MRSSLSWDRGRPARKWAEGPPVLKRARCPRSQENLDAERSFLGPRASRPHVGRRPTGVLKRARCPRSQGKRPCGAVFLGPRASRPQVGRRPTGVLKRARCPRSQVSIDAERSFPGARASRPHVGRRPTGVQAGKMPALPGEPRCGAVFPGSAGVPPACGPKAHRCSSGQDARAPGRASMRSGLSRERGRPARMWAEGPPVFKRARCPRSRESLDAERSFPGPRASRPHVGRRPTGVQAGKMPALPGEPRCGAVFPGTAGVPPASGPQAHRCVEAGKMPAIPGEPRCGAVFPGSALRCGDRRGPSEPERALPAHPGACVLNGKIGAP